MRAVERQWSGDAQKELQSILRQRKAEADAAAAVVAEAQRKAEEAVRAVRAVERQWSGDAQKELQSILRQRKAEADAAAAAAALAAAAKRKAEADAIAAERAEAQRKAAEEAVLRRSEQAKAEAAAALEAAKKEAAAEKAAALEKAAMEKADADKRAAEKAAAATAKKAAATRAERTPAPPSAATTAATASSGDEKPARGVLPADEPPTAQAGLHSDDDKAARLPQPALWLTGAAAALLLLSSVGHRNESPSTSTSASVRSREQVTPRKKTTRDTGGTSSRVGAPSPRQQLLLRPPERPAKEARAGRMGVTRRIPDKGESAFVARARDNAVAKRRAELEAARRVADLADARRGEQLREMYNPKPRPVAVQVASQSPVQSPVAEALQPTEEAPASVTGTIGRWIQRGAGAPGALAVAVGAGVVGLVVRIASATSAQSAASRIEQSAKAAKAAEEERWRQRQMQRERAADAARRTSNMLVTSAGVVGAATALITSLPVPEPRLETVVTQEVVAAGQERRLAQMEAEQAVHVLLKTASQSQEARAAALNAQRELEEARAATRQLTAVTRASGTSARGASAARFGSVPSTAPPLREASTASGDGDEIALNIGAGAAAVIALATITRLADAED